MTCYGSDIVNVFTPKGQYSCQYGQSHLNCPYGIAIDSAGNSLVVNYRGNSLSIKTSLCCLLESINVKLGLPYLMEDLAINSR